MSLFPLSTTDISNSVVIHTSGLRFHPHYYLHVFTVKERLVKKKSQLYLAWDMYDHACHFNVKSPKRGGKTLNYSVGACNLLAGKSWYVRN